MNTTIINSRVEWDKWVLNRADWDDSFLDEGEPDCWYVREDDYPFVVIWTEAEFDDYPVVDWMTAKAVLTGPVEGAVPYVDVPVTFQCGAGAMDTEALSKARRLINEFHEGRPNIPIQEKTSRKCADAHSALHRWQSFRLMLRIDANGNKSLPNPLLRNAVTPVKEKD